MEWLKSVRSLKSLLGPSQPPLHRYRQALCPRWLQACLAELRLCSNQRWEPFQPMAIVSGHLTEPMTLVPPMAVWSAFHYFALLFCGFRTLGHGLKTAECLLHLIALVCQLVIISNYGMFMDVSLQRETCYDLDGLVLCFASWYFRSWLKCVNISEALCAVIRESCRTFLQWES